MDALRRFCRVRFFSEVLVNFLHHRLLVFVIDIALRRVVYRHSSASRSENIAVLIVFIRSRGSSGSIVSDYGLDDRGSIPDRGRGFFF
jgi:hypothetical protein